MAGLKYVYLIADKRNARNFFPGLKKSILIAAYAFQIPLVDLGLKSNPFYNIISPQTFPLVKNNPAYNSAV